MSKKLRLRRKQVYAIATVCLISVFISYHLWDVSRIASYFFGALALCGCIVMKLIDLSNRHEDREERIKDAANRHIEKLSKMYDEYYG
ncbi:hypothetical protein ACFL20_10455 [Spirochaetota bacterium]